MAPLLLRQVLSPPPAPAASGGEERPRRWRFVLVALLLILAAGAGALVVVHEPAGRASSTRLCFAPARGWRARTRIASGTVPSLDLTNFAFGRAGYLGGHDDPELRWPAGGILITVHDWTVDALRATRSRYVPNPGPLRIAAGSFHPFEGVADLGIRQVTFHGRLLELWVQARPTTAAAIARANQALAHVRVCE